MSDSDTPISDSEMSSDRVVPYHVAQGIEKVSNNRRDEIKSLRALVIKHEREAANERIMRYAADAERNFQYELSEKLAGIIRDWERRSESCESKLGQLEANERLIAETARCAQIAREFTLSPVVGKAIAALILYQNTSQQGQSSNIQVNAGSAGAAPTSQSR